MLKCYRWVKKGSDVQEALLRNLQVPHLSRAAYWVFDINKYKPSPDISGERDLLVICFNKEGEDIIKNKFKQLNFLEVSPLKESQHQDKIIIKPNEPGAYGIGQNVLKDLKSHIQSVRLASSEDVVKALKR